MRSPGFRHRLEYAGFRLVSTLLGGVPERLALVLGEVLGWVAGTVFRIRRAEVDRHLELAFPHRPRGWRKRVARASYRHLGREGIAVLRLSRLSAGEVRERTRVDGLEALQAAVEGRRGAVIVTGHLGNWEIGGASVAARGVPLDVIAVRQSNPLFDRELQRTRKDLGLRVILKEDASKEALRSLRKGRAVALLADQDARGRGIFVDFFGRPASTYRGPALFARRTGAPLFTAVALREGARSLRYRVRIRRVEMEETGDLEDDVRRLTQAHTRILQGWVEEVPEQYFWHHRRWKTSPSSPDSPA